jgi:hypothetical protein
MRCSQKSVFSAHSQNVICKVAKNDFLPRREKENKETIFLAQLPGGLAQQAGGDAPRPAGDTPRATGDKQSPAGSGPRPSQRGDLCQVQSGLLGCQLGESVA